MKFLILYLFLCFSIFGRSQPELFTDSVYIYIGTGSQTFIIQLDNYCGDEVTVNIDAATQSIPDAFEIQWADGSNHFTTAYMGAAGCTPPQIGVCGYGVHTVNGFQPDTIFPADYYFATFFPPALFRITLVTRESSFRLRTIPNTIWTGTAFSFYIHSTIYTDSEPPEEIHFYETVCDSSLVGIDTFIIGLPCDTLEYIHYELEPFSEVDFYETVCDTSLVKIDTVIICNGFEYTHYELDPMWNFDINIDTLLDQYTFITFYSSSQLSNFMFDGMLSNSIEFYLTDSTEIFVQGETPGGCIISGTINVDANKSDFYIPNAFTPNNDGINDYFEIYTRSQYASAQLFVYDRWGALIHQSNNLIWNGLNRKVHKPYPIGVYVFVAKIKRISGAMIQFDGDITILK